ncbi:response regulator [Marinobacteraceae bacterium S3BR75-40.1]
MRLLVYVLLFSVVLSIVAAGVQLAGEYRQEKGDLLEMQQQAAKMVSASLSTNLWHIRLDEARNDLEGLLSLPGIHYARVTTTEGRVLQVGEAPDQHTVEYSYTLKVDRPDTGIPVQVGTLNILSSLEPLYSRLWDRGLATLLSQGVIVLLGALVLLLIVRMMLTRHLTAMADFANQLNFDALIAPLQLRRRPPSRPDELSDLERALNTMRLQLLDEARRLRESELQSQGERDKAVRANQAKNLFLANVSHELRTPLQSVLGYAALIEHSDLDPEQRDYVSTLKRSAENLSSIINDLLDISRMEAGKLELEQIPFDIRDTVDDVITMLAPRAREKRLALERRIPDHLPAALLGDPIRLRQVLLNLVSNAIRFTDSGHVMISAEVLERSPRDVKVRFAVEDTGVGIAKEDLPLIYEPYVQLGSRFRRKLSGAGLGLTICRQLVHLMSGSLDVESTPGRGSTFWVDLTLPVASEHSAMIRQDTRAIQSRRLLVADSYELSRKITLELLSGFGAEVDGVRSAAEVIRRLEEAEDVGHPYDALLVDGFLPDMDCDLLCQQLRDSRHAETRILVLSSNPQRGDAEHFRQAGADGFLSKSLRESYLAPVLQQLLLDHDQYKRHFVTRFTVQSNQPPPDDPVAPCASMQVLLVEDNPVNRALTQRMLEKLGAVVTSAHDGEEAELLLREEAFDLVFMDCMLPGQDGFETTRHYRRWEAETGRPRVPVVALTANAMEKDEEKCRKSGMDAFIAKPVTMEMLRAILAQYCQPSHPKPAQADV